MMLRKTNNLPLSRVSEEEAGGREAIPKDYGIASCQPTPIAGTRNSRMVILSKTSNKD